MHTIFEPYLLGTGGAVKNVRNFWKDEPFLVINADIITDIDISKAYKWHVEKGSFATLILHHYPRFKRVKLDSNSCITDISRREDISSLSFTGIHVLEPELVNYMPCGSFDIVDFYRGIIKKGLTIKGYVSFGHRWRDIGTIKDYINANKETLGNSALLIDKTSIVHPSTRFVDWAIVGKNCVIEESCIISRSILWENTKIKRGVRIADSIITGGEIKEDLKNIVA